MTSFRNKDTFWLIAIIITALALRLHNLTYHSLWFDEAISVYWAQQSTTRILEVGFTLVEDRLPPLYYLTLKGWSGLFGFSEIGVRSLSVFFGVLLVPVTATLARMLFNRRIALLTALLVALNPFLIWYSQEARMYAPAVLFSALAVWAFLGMIVTATENPVKRHSPFAVHHLLFTILFILFATAGLYSHLYAGFLLPALGLWLVISYPRAWHLWLRYALSGVVITLAFAPIALAIWRFSGEAAPGQPLAGLSQRVWWLLHAFTIWKAPLPLTLEIATQIIVLFFILCAYLKPTSKSSNPAAGSQVQSRPIRSSISNYQLLFTNLQSPLSRPLLLITLLLLTPFLIATLLLFRNHLAFFGERYFIVMVPWLLLLAAVGANKLSHLAQQQIRRVTPPQTRKRHAATGTQASRITFYILRVTAVYLPFLILITATILPLPGQWSSHAAKEFWRQSVAYLAQHARPDHGILIHPDWVRYPFQYYFQGPNQTYAAFSNVTPKTALDGPLQGVVGSHPVIWLIQSHVDRPDPDRLVEQWFATRYPLVTELFPPGIALKAYAPGYQLETLPREATPVDFRFENGLRLVGYQADPTAAAADDFFHPPSGWLHVTLYWTAARSIREDVAPYVHLVNPEGVWGINLERPNDALELYPPSRWPADPGKSPIIRHDVDVNLNPATPPGLYQLVVGMRGEETQYALTEVEIR